MTLNITFQGDWKYPFDVTDTKDRNFYTTTNKTVTVPTMYQENTFSYAQSEELQAQVCKHNTNDR